MRGLPMAQQPDSQKLISPTFAYRIIKLTRPGLTIHPARFDQCLPSNEN